MRIVRFIRVILAILFIYWLSMGILFLSYAYTKGWILANFDSVDAKYAIELMKKNSNTLILDVRTKEEFKEQHLHRAINIPLQILTTKLSNIDIHKHQQILVYCRSGNRSVKASRILKANDFIPLNIKGGMQQLKRHHAPVTGVD